MDNNKKTQKARDNSTQNQIDVVNVFQGVTEQRTREIFDEMFELERQNYSNEAFQTAKERIGEFEKILIPRMSSIDGALNSFADPYFQFLLRDAQKAAGSTKEIDDYKMLAELLVCHVEKGNERSTKTSIKMAIDIVNLIDQTDLCALTVAHAVSTYLPTSGFCNEGLKVLNNLFSKIMYKELPKGNEWQENLDMLGAIRISSLGRLNKLPDIYKTSLNKYVCAGIKKDSENHKKAIALLKNVDSDRNYLVDNELLDGYVRIPVCSDDMVKNFLVSDSQGIRRINDKEKDYFNNVFKLYSTDTNLMNSVGKKFDEIWNSFENLCELTKWWNSIPESFRVTPVGNTLAHTNAKRCDPTIPDLI